MEATGVYGSRSGASSRRLRADVGQRPPRQAGPGGAGPTSPTRRGCASWSRPGCSRQTSCRPSRSASCASSRAIAKPKSPSASARPTACTTRSRTPTSSSTASRPTSSRSRDGRCSTRSAPAPPIPRSSPSWPRGACGPSSPSSGRRWRGASTSCTRCRSGRSSHTWTSSMNRSTGSQTPSSSAWPLSDRRLSCCAPYPAWGGIPGVGRRTGEAILAEIRPDMSVFPSARHLASWAGQCPGNDRSAGRQRSGKTRKGSRWLNHAQGGRDGQRSQIGHGKAIGVVKHSTTCACWHMLITGELYRKAGGNFHPTRPQTRHPTRRRPARAARTHARSSTPPLDPDRFSLQSSGSAQAFACGCRRRNGRRP